jgi:hypothetical protein
MKLVLGLCLCCLFTCGGCCSQRLGDFTVLTTKNINLSNFSTKDNLSAGTERVSGSDVSHMICVFPTKVPNFKDAIDDAIEQGNCDLLSEAVIRYEFFYIPLIYGQEKFVVEGCPVAKK